MIIQLLTLILVDTGDKYVLFFWKVWFFLWYITDWYHFYDNLDQLAWVHQMIGGSMFLETVLPNPKLSLMTSLLRCFKKAFLSMRRWVHRKGWNFWISCAMKRLAQRKLYCNICICMYIYILNQFFFFLCAWELTCCKQSFRVLRDCFANPESVEKKKEAKEKLNAAKANVTVKST